MIKGFALREVWVALVEYCIARDFLYRQRTKIWLEPAPQDARSLTTIRLWLAGAAAAIFLDALSGSHLMRRGLVSFLAMVLTPYALAILANRLAGVDEQRAVSAPPSAARFHAIAYRCLSVFVVLPLLLGVAFFAKYRLEKQLVRELEPIYDSLHRDDRSAAWDRLKPMVEDEYWTPEQLTLVALVMLRDGGNDDRVRQYFESAAVRAHTSRSKACGSHVSTIDRSTCGNYAGAVEIHDKVLSDEFKRRYCAAFGQEFPQPDLGGPGCGTPADTKW